MKENTKFSVASSYITFNVNGDGNDQCVSVSALPRLSSEHNEHTWINKTWLNKLLYSFSHVFFRSKLSFFILFIPAAIGADAFSLPNAWVFAFSLLGLAPIAESLAFVTEQIAFSTGATVGGLMNATCGNAPEMIIAVFALWNGKTDLVKYSLLGSVLSNILLVLGTSLFCGGLVKKEQNFDRAGSTTNLSMLFMSLIMVALPLAINLSENGDSAETSSSVLCLSRAESIIMLISYGVYLLFQLKTHKQLFDQPEEEEEDESIGMTLSVISLCLLTILITILSQYIVATIEDAAKSLKISLNFISLVLLPIAGNAAEHAGAVLFAIKDKLDLSISVAVSSATQIIMFVMPFIILVAWTMGKPLALDFRVVETCSLILSTLIATYTLHDGTSNYMKGLILLFCYFIMAFSFFVVQSPNYRNTYHSSMYKLYSTS